MENIAYETMKRFYLIAYEKRVRLPKNAGSMRKIAQKLYERAAVSAARLDCRGIQYGEVKYLICTL
jgi:hypothetical protein